MEETETSKTKASDSAYSNSSTSQYQRSNGSSKSRHSNSSGSSGYCGHPSILSSGNDEGFPQPQTCAKRKEKKRKQHKVMECLSSSSFWEQEGRGEEGNDSGMPAGVTVVNGSSSTGAPPSGINVIGGTASATEVTPIKKSTTAEVGNGSDSEVLQMAALTQTLHCIKKMKAKDSTLKCLQGENGSPRNGSGPLDSRVKEHLASCFSKDSCSPQDEGESFVVVVSMADGTVVHTSRNLTASLGFPSDMWLGRDFIDFVHPKDRMAFAGHITSGVARGEDSTCKGLPPKTSFYCSLRQYRGLRNVGYGVTRKQVPYLPFCLTLTFREMNAAAMGSKAANPTEEAAAALNPLETQLQHQGKTGEPGTEELNGSVFIVIAATRIYSAYQVPNEEILPPATRKTPPPPPSSSLAQAQKPSSFYTTGAHPPVVMGKFVTRHLSSCHLSHIDPAAVPYLGYLPQDMEARSVMDFYHPEDMPILKEAYQNVMSQQSSPFKGKPYRFRTQNGTYILVETEWSSFVNPWSRKLEFVIGQHHVLKGPSNPDVFAEPKEENCPQFSDEVLKGGESIQKEIMLMLDQVCSGNKKVTRVSESARQQVSKRCRDLASFMESLMDEMAKPVDPLRVELPAHDDQCFSERDSVMLGEISPHHDFYDGKSSTETPPSYNQLNYNENLQRFFESKPKTASSDESGEMKLAGSSSNNRSPLSTDEEGKSFPMALDSSSASGGERKWCSRANESESGGSGSRARPGVVGEDSCHDDHDPGGGGGGDKIAGEGISKCKGKRGGGNLEVTPKGSRVLSSHEKGRTLNNCCTGSFHSPHLTEALLNRHNEDMEKQMVQKHREQRSLDREGKVKDGRKSNVEKVQDPLISHGVKRSVSHSWEGEPQRVKHQHIEQQGNQDSGAGCQQLWEQQHQQTACTKAVPLTTSSSVQNNPNPISANAPSSSAPRNGKIVQSGLRVQPVQLPSSPSLNLWPPFSVTLTPLNNTQPCLSYSCPGMTHQQHPISNLPMSGPPPSSAQIQQQPTAVPMELPPQQCPPSLRYPPPAAPAVHHAAFSHSLNPHQGFIPVFYVPTGPGIMSTSVDAGNSSTQSRLLGYSHQQVQQQQMPSFPYLVPTHHSQATGLPSMAGTSYIPNHLQYINTFPQMVYQSVSHAQATGPSVQQAYVSSVNNLMAGTTAPPSTHLSAPMANPSPPSPLPPRSLSSAQNHPQFARIRRSARNHQSGHLLHHVRLQQPPAVAVKSLSRQGNFLRGRDGLGVVLVTDRDAVSSNTVPDKTLQKEGRDESRSPLIFSKCQRPSSQATSVKAEPGSAVGSVASASRLRELLEVSKKCKSIGSTGFSRTNTVMEEEEEEEDFEGRDGMGMTSHDRKNHNVVQEFSLLQDRDTLCDDSSYSSLYSFLRTERSDESMQSFTWDSRGDCAGNNQKHCGPKGKGGGVYAEKNGLKPARKGPSWMEEVDVTPDLILRYKMDDQILCNVLEADLKALKTISQSSTVNEQLSQLYMDMELEGATTKLSLEDSTGFTSSSGTDEASGAYNNISVSPTPSKMSHKLKKKRRSLDYGKLVMIFEENAPIPPPSVPTCSQ